MVFFGGLILLAVFSLFFYLNTGDGLSNDWKGDMFIHNHPDSLNQRGWKIYNRNERFLENQDSGSLKVYTLRGDMFKQEFPIQNTLVHKISCEKCEIEVCISDFNPNMPWQQAGIFLFNGKNEIYDDENFLRYTFAYGGENSVVVENNWWQILQAYFVKNGKVIDNGEVKLQPIDYDSAGKYVPVFRLWLKIVIDRSSFSLYYKKNYDHHAYQSLTKAPIDLPFMQPEFVGIAGFHGVAWGNDPKGNFKGFLNADTISARFDYIKLSSTE